jgi:hypothetical protein
MDMDDELFDDTCENAASIPSVYNKLSSFLLFFFYWLHAFFQLYASMCLVLLFWCYFQHLSISFHWPMVSFIDASVSNSHPLPRVSLFLSTGTHSFPIPILPSLTGHREKPATTAQPLPHATLHLQPDLSAPIFLSPADCNTPPQPLSQATALSLG